MEFSWLPRLGYDVQWGGLKRSDEGFECVLGEGSYVPLFCKLFVQNLVESVVMYKDRGVVRWCKRSGYGWGPYAETVH